MNSTSNSFTRDIYGYQPFAMANEESTSQYPTIFDDDDDLEQMVNRFMANSKSAHADLAQMATKISKPKKFRDDPNEEDETSQEDEAEDDVDSDEEFYVHKSLLPMRKSKSSTAGFLRQLNSWNDQVEKERRKTESELMSQIEAQKQAFLAEYRRKASIQVLTAKNASIDQVWPEPDPDPEVLQQYQPTTSLKIPEISVPKANLVRGDVIKVSVDDSYNDMGISDGCWSSPGNFYEDESDDENDYDSDLDESDHGVPSFSPTFAPRRPLFRSWSSPASFDQPPLDFTEDLYNTPQARRFSAIVDEDSLQIFALKAQSQIRRSKSFEPEKFSKRKNFWAKRRKTSTLGFVHFESALVEEDGDMESEVEEMKENAIEERKESSENERFYDDEETLEADKLLEMQADNDTDLEKMSVSSSIHQQLRLDEDQMSLEEDDFEEQVEHPEDSDEEIDEEEEDIVEPLDSGLAEFSVRRRSQFFIAKSASLPQSKSDSQLKAQKLKGRSMSFNQPEVTKMLRHSYTYHEGSSRQDIEDKVDLPDDLVESFALENDDDEGKTSESDSCSLQDTEEEVEEEEDEGLVESCHPDQDEEDRPKGGLYKLPAKGVRGTHSFYDIQEHVASVIRSQTDYNLSVKACQPSTSRDSHFTEESFEPEQGSSRDCMAAEGQMDQKIEQKRAGTDDNCFYGQKGPVQDQNSSDFVGRSSKADDSLDKEDEENFQASPTNPPRFPVDDIDEDVSMRSKSEMPTTYDNINDTDEEDLPLDVMDEVTGSLEELRALNSQHEPMDSTRNSDRSRRRDLLLSGGIPDRAESLPRSWVPDKTKTTEEKEPLDLRARLENVALTAMANALESIERQEVTENGPKNRYGVTPEDDVKFKDTRKEIIKSPAALQAKRLFGTSRSDMSAVSTFAGDYADFPMADDETAPVSIPIAKVPKPVLRRRSPPIASEDELSESEISELERQLASGGAFDAPYATRKYDLRQDFDSDDSADEENMPSAACQSELSAHHLYAMAGSSSLPSFAFTADVYETLAEEMVKDQRDQLEETAQWLRKSKTQCFENNAPPPGLNSNFGSRRRILPMRPDDVPSAQIHPTPAQPLVRAFTQEQHQQLRQVIQNDAANENIVLATPNSLEHAKKLHSTTVIQSSPQVHVPRRLPTLPVEGASAQYNMYNGPSGSATNVPIVPKYIPRHAPPSNQIIPRGTMASQAGHRHEYQLSYGIEQSLVRSSTNYGLEDSYYEDGLNGNTAIFDHKRPVYAAEDSSGISSFTSDPNPTGGPTHRAQFTFVPRHDDEVLMEVGDALRVEREYEDHWCYGINLRTGQTGLFPAAHVCEIDLIEEISNSVLNPGQGKSPVSSAERDTFYLTMLASIEVAHHKGNDVLVQAINKVCEMYQRKEEILVPQTVLMEVSFRGIHIIDKRKKDIFRCPTFDYFYSLQNISFCGAHPTQLRYFGFLTKHPLLPRFACHVFLSQSSTQPIVESIGRAFKRSYDEYMAFAHPTEDIYIE
ncbi:unnamed protein product [Bursaphelenchus xylophilus]|uniref:(pine wood nematode) hypothetical protein n=1 Tax=Bursaphelenchus xylophilus TaxID=6326 RepID=A0A1I7SD28_BURXY|nr:unnamed protein product [Bursaphelenchus xylophilus]CAG9093041.1 unnamed protein product [Bursaphelenchus xylophilus]